MTFEAVIGSVASDTNPDIIAIDDVLLRDGSCPVQGNCDFENGICSWSNNAKGSTASGIPPADVDWFVGQGTPFVPSDGPVEDHTFGSELGWCHYSNETRNFMQLQF